MRNVGSFRHFAGLVCALLLTACTQTPVDVSTLGLKLSAPQLKSSSPFDQDIDEQGYVEFSGTCNGFVSNLSLGMDGQTWFNIPAQTTYTPASGAMTTYNNDTDCADETFSFYLTRDMIDTWVGHATTEDEIKTIFLRGDGMLGETEALVLTDSDNNRGGGPPTALHLDNNFPSGFGALGNCTEMQATLLGDSDETSGSTAISFAVSEVPSGGVSLYGKREDCQNNNASGLIVAPSIAAGNSNTRFFVRLPSSGSSVTYQISTTATGLSTNSKTITLRDPSSNKWVSLDQAPRRLYKNVCYPMKLVARNYDGSLWGGHTTAIAVTPAISDSNFHFSSDANCSDTVSNPVIPSYSDNLVVYGKYTDTVTTSGKKIFQLSVTAPSTDGYNVDGDTLAFSVDLNDNADSIQRLGLAGPNTIGSGFCQKYEIQMLNQNWAVMKNITGSTLLVDLDFQDNITGGFYSTETSCTVQSGPISQISIAAGEFSATVYFRGVSPTTVSSTLSASQTGLNSGALAVTVSPVPYQFTVNFGSAPGNVNKYQRIFGGWGNNCVIDSNSHLRCTGDNSYHQLLDGTDSASLVFKIVDAGNQYQSAAVGMGFICGLTTTGDINCWGRGDSGQLGPAGPTLPATTGDYSETVLNVGTGFIAVSAGDAYACGLTSAGSVQCWGANTYGQLGNGTTSDNRTPQTILTGAKAISAGSMHACAVMNDGALKCWGSNLSDAIGVNSSGGDYTSPQTVFAADVISVSAGYSHTCAITNPFNNLYCWGNNSYGQLGINSSTSKNVPTIVSGNYQQVIAGHLSTCAILLNASHAVYCWGFNGQGQVGNGNQTDQLAPAKVLDMPSIDVSASLNSHCAITADNDLYCWGQNVTGELGDDSVLNAPHFFPQANVCFQMQTNVTDASGNSINSPDLITLQSYATNAKFYTDFACVGASASTASISIPSGGNQSLIYFRKTSTASADFSFTSLSSVKSPPPASY